MGPERLEADPHEELSSWKAGAVREDSNQPGYGIHRERRTDIELIERNLEEMIYAARRRWKIENEGFNNQKNGIYDIEHLNSRNSNRMKNHYLLTQTADRDRMEKKNR